MSLDLLYFEFLKYMCFVLNEILSNCCVLVFIIFLKLHIFGIICSNEQINRYPKQYLNKVIYRSKE